MSHNVCPWWMGYFLLNPLRRLIQNPNKILNKFVKQNMKVLDIGAGMGYFSLPLAELVGAEGKVICVDLQARMIEGLVKRSQKVGLDNRIETRICKQNTLMLADIVSQIDFALAFAIVHEVPDKERFFREIYETLKVGGKLLVAEPKGHVTKNSLNYSISLAEQVGFKVIEKPVIARSHAILLQK